MYGLSLHFCPTKIDGQNTAEFHWKWGIAPEKRTKCHCGQRSNAGLAFVKRSISLVGRKTGLFWRISAKMHPQDHMSAVAEATPLLGQGFEPPAKECSPIDPTKPIRSDQQCRQRQ